jgi:predicted DNA-binding transcriptional regulator AlpA
MPSARLWTLDDVMRYADLSRKTVEDLIKAGRFPAPVKVGRSLRWRETDIDNWEASLFPVDKAPIRVKFVRCFPPYNDGEEAGFPPGQAASLIANGWAALSDPDDREFLTPYLIDAAKERDRVLGVIADREAAEAEKKAPADAKTKKK